MVGPVLLLFDAFQQLLSFFWFLPKTRSMGQQFFLPYCILFAVDVKDASSGLQRAP